MCIRDSPLQALRLIGENKGRAGFSKLLGDAVGNAALVGEAEDYGDLALEIDHAGPSEVPRVRIAAAEWVGRRDGGDAGSSAGRWLSDLSSASGSG